MNESCQILVRRTNFFKSLVPTVELTFSAAFESSVAKPHPIRFEYYENSRIPMMTSSSQFHELLIPLLLFKSTVLACVLYYNYQLIQCPLCIKLNAHISTITCIISSYMV